MGQSDSSPVEPAALTDEQIDRIAENCVKSMDGGIQGFCKTWGWHQFARELLDVCAGHVRATPAGAAAVPASDPTANERELRKMLCVAYVGVAAYMDDGEAQDNTVMPYIDFLRDAPATIRSKMRSRAWKTDATHPVRSAGG